MLNRKGWDWGWTGRGDFRATTGCGWGRTVSKEGPGSRKGHGSTNPVGMGWSSATIPFTGECSGISIPGMICPLHPHFLDFHPSPPSTSISWRACGSRRPDSTSPFPRGLAQPTSPSPSLSFPGRAAADPKPATGCSAAPRPRGGSVGLALAPPGAAETSQPLAKGSETFPLARRSRLRPRAAPPPSTCPTSLPDRGAGKGGSPTPNFSFSLFRCSTKKLLSLQQRRQPRALKIESHVQRTGAGKGAGDGPAASGLPKRGGRTAVSRRGPVRWGGDGDPAGGHAASRSPVSRGPLRSPPARLPASPASPAYLPLASPPSPPPQPSISSFPRSILLPSPSSALSFPPRQTWILCQEDLERQPRASPPAPASRNAGTHRDSRRQAPGDAPHAHTTHSSHTHVTHAHR